MMKESFRTLAVDMQVMIYNYNSKNILLTSNNSKNILVLFCRKLHIFKRDVKLADNTLDKQAAVLTDRSGEAIYILHHLYWRKVK